MKHFLCFALVLLPFIAMPQVAINTDGSSADSSAILDISSTSGGLLIPRMSTAQREGINNPATGLMVYDTDLDKFYCQAGGIWIELMSDYVTYIKDADSDTRIEVEATPDEDIIRFDLNGIEHFVMNGPRLGIFNSGQSVFIGERAGEIDDLGNNGSVFTGFAAGQKNISGQLNVANGYKALNKNTSGFYNTSLGAVSLFNNTIGQENIAVGESSLFLNTTGSRNSATGCKSMINNKTGANNVANGYQSLCANNSGSYNVAIGREALCLNASGSNSIAIGYQAMYNNTAGGNTSIGNQAMYSNTSGSSNTSLGRKSLYANTIGFHNTAVGEDALLSNTTGQYNLAVGNKALQENQTGTRNVAIGHVALRDATGSRNVAVGVDAGQQNTGSYNVFLGFESGLSNTGSTNVFLGYRAGKTATGNNRLFIDNHDDATPLIYGEFADDELVIYGELGINKKDPAFPIHLSSGAHCTVGGVWTNASDISKKNGVRELPYGLSDIMSMRPVMYEYKIDSSTSLGFIAQEMEKIIPEAVSGEEGEKGIAYGLLTSVLVQGMQDLVTQNDKLTLQNNKLSSQLQFQQQSIDALMTRLEEVEKNLSTKSLDN